MITTRILFPSFLMLSLVQLSSFRAQAEPAVLSQSKTWTLQAWTKGGKKINAQANTTTLTVKGLHMHGMAGVNSYRARYSASRDGELRVRMLSVTEMAGPPKLMAQEAAYLALLGRMTSFKVEGDTLTLSNKKADEALHFVIAKPADPKPLRGTAWSLAHFESSDGETDSATGLVENTTISLTIDANGKVAGSGGVNRYFANVTVGEDGAVKFAKVGSTRRAGPPAAMKQEHRYFTQLESMTSYSITGKRLTLSNKDGSMKLTFEAP